MQKRARKIAREVYFVLEIEWVTNNLRLSPSLDSFKVLYYNFITFDLMQLSRYIQELLYQYECVTIPQFGAFLTRSFKAKIDHKGVFYPPRKEVNFNQLLFVNDGLLAHF